ncbi:hypothetical protein GCM10011297_09090 [Bacterioplanes sanyensis]|uniref:hypothetical protein n=1 Tax=Bacterioplanes sanyensis TaxID=1249553 RepID=UPI0016790241|nr:hypothetical protein [Bacterioplanes sanyensis]GGY38129.1 hypothetical protein GCM10011297_09090 [Bacterioplanes sanyensis]
MSPDVKQRINFYTAEFHPPRLPAPVARLLLGLAAVSIVLLMIGSVLSWQAQQQQQQRDHWQQQREQASTQLQQLRDSLPPLQQDADLLAQQQRLQSQRRGAQAVLSYLTQGKLEQSQSFSRLLQGLTQLSGQGVWLAGVRIERGGEALTLKGYLQRPEQLSTYVESLLQLPGYRGRAFRHIQLQEVEEQNWLQFELASDGVDDEQGDNG